MTRRNSSNEISPDTSQVFISYSHTDREFADKVRKHLMSLGYNVWMDAYDIPPGKPWDDEIDEALRNSDVIIGVMTPASVDSREVKNEWHWALKEENVELLLLLLEKCEVQYRYDRVQRIDFTTADKRSAYTQLEHALAAYRKDEVETRTPPPPNGELILIQRFHPSSSPDWMDFVQEGEQFWTSNGEQVEIFARHSPHPVDKWVLPNIRWKQIFPQRWRGRVLCSDWDGSLYAFDNQTDSQSQVIYSARYDDLPIHRIAVGSSGQLVAATWDGKLLAWDAEGNMILEPRVAAIPHLPLHLLSCGQDRIVVADQARTIWLFDHLGQLVWRWQADGAIDTMWAWEDQDCGEAANLTFFLLLDCCQVARIRAGEQQAKENLPSSVTTLARLEDRQGERWVVLAFEDRTLAWLSCFPFRLFSSSTLHLDWDVQQLIAVRDPQRPKDLIAMGLNRNGQLFTLENQKHKLYSTPPIRSLRVDPSGRFMFWILPDRIEMYRNPAVLATSCEVTVSGVEGTLLVGEYRKISLDLTNSGAVPISRITAKLRGKGRILPSKEVTKQGMFLPGDHIFIAFSIQAIAAGSLEVTLEVTMEDEAGPPPSHMYLDLLVESTKS